MRQLMRLIRYALPRWWQILSSVLLMATVGGLDAFKYLLVRPVFDRVLNPVTGSKDIQLFLNPLTHHPVYLQQFVPARFTNAWTIVAFALVASVCREAHFRPNEAAAFLRSRASKGAVEART